MDIRNTINHTKSFIVKIFDRDAYILMTTCIVLSITTICILGAGIYTTEFEVNSSLVDNIKNWSEVFSFAFTAIAAVIAIAAYSTWNEELILKRDLETDEKLSESLKRLSKEICISMAVIAEDIDYQSSESVSKNLIKTINSKKQIQEEYDNAGLIFEKPLIHEQYEDILKRILASNFLHTLMIDLRIMQLTNLKAIEDVTKTLVQGYKDNNESQEEEFINAKRKAIKLKETVSELSENNLKLINEYSTTLEVIKTERQKLREVRKEIYKKYKRKTKENI